MIMCNGEEEWKTMESSKCCTAVHFFEAADVNENPIVYVKANDEKDRSCQMRVGSVVLWSISLELQIR